MKIRYLKKVYGTQLGKVYDLPTQSADVLIRIGVAEEVKPEPKPKQAAEPATKRTYTTKSKTKTKSTKKKSTKTEA